eukprot:7519379-Pyramimonas_sp.AAC.1
MDIPQRACIDGDALNAIQKARLHHRDISSDFLLHRHLPVHEIGASTPESVSYTHLRAHETGAYL